MKTLGSWLLSVCFLSLILCRLVVVIVPPVYAQSPTAQPTSSQSTDAQLNSLRNQYRTQLEVYQTDERDFSIARDQYNQLQTLTSLEDAVKSTQKVLLSRDDVLITYTKMMQITFSQSTGIQLDLKNGELKFFDSILSDLNKNHDEAGLATSRDTVEQVAVDFSPISSELQSAISESQLLMSYGKVQALFDKTVVTRDDIKTHVLAQQTDALKLSEKQRAFVQIDDTVTMVDSELKAVLNSFTNPSTYNNTQPTENLNQAYAGISRTLSYLGEVLNN